jgi:hypothetical protein
LLQAEAKEVDTMTNFRLIVIAILILALGCGGGPASTTAPRSSSSDFQQLCRAVGAEGDSISRDKFLAQAKDKDAAARLFDACDADRDRVITEEEVRQQGRMDELKRQAIRLTTPGGP